AQLHLAAREPRGALLRLGDVAPDPLDRPGQEPLEAHCAGFEDRAIGVVVGHITAHRLLLLPGLASGLRNSRSRSSRRPAQKWRTLRIQASISSRPSGFSR